MRILLVYPTHSNCREVEKPFLRAGIDAATYPQRTTSETDHTPQNCWNITADEAEMMGFPVVKTVCPTCPSRGPCSLSGYLRQLAVVKQATVAICTHKRAEFSGLSALMKDRHFVSLHENPIDILRPKMEVSEPDLREVRLVIERLLTDPHYLDWFGETTAVDDDGNRYQDEELILRRERQYDYLRHLTALTDDLATAMEVAEATTEWRYTAVLNRPAGIERTLFWATRETRARFMGQPWHFLLAAASGELISSAIIVSKLRRQRSDGHPPWRRLVIGFRDNRPLRSATTWFNDATLCTETLTSILGTEVQDKTSGGRLELRKKAVQIVRDITRRTSHKTFANILRGVLAERPQFQRIGIICHSSHIDVCQSLEPEFARRIAKTAYFGSGEERSSNAWHHECDLIIIAGTPRVPPQEIASYLVQIGEPGIACHEPEWGTLHWEGRTESGEPITVQARGYRNETWRMAHRSLVRASLVQAIGRGRGILETGCEVIVLSNEECGLLISDSGMEMLNGSSARVLQALQAVTMENRNKYLIRKSIVSTSDIAGATGLSVVRTRELLRDLEPPCARHIQELFDDAVDRGPTGSASNQDNGLRSLMMVRNRLKHCVSAREAVTIEAVSQLAA